MRLLIGSIVVVILALVAVLANRPGEYSFNNDQAGIAWRPAFAEKLNTVNKIEVHQALQPTITISKLDDQWVVENLNNYPAKATQVRHSLLSLAQFKLVQAMTSKPEKYGKLQLRDVHPPSNDSLTSQPAPSKATLVKVFDNNTEIASLLLGKVQYTAFGTNSPAKAEPGQFVRVPDARQTWLIDRAIPVPTKATGWVDTTVLNIREASVRKLTVRQLNGAGKALNTLIATRQEQDGPFTVPGLKNADASKVTAELGGMLERLQFADVLPRDQLKIDDKAGKHVITGETFDGLTATLELAQDVSGKSWALISASISARAKEAVKVGDAADNTADNTTGAAAKNLPSTAELQANTINARGKRWAYALPDGRVKGLQARKQDFVRK